MELCAIDFAGDEEELKVKQTKYDFDVFISYSHEDEKWVTATLLQRLEQAELKVCIDFRDFEPGKPSLFNMQSAVRHSRRILLVLTPNWFDSEWTLFESMLGATKDPAGFRPRLIPLLLEKSEMPENADFIAALTYINFTRADRLDLAWRQLLTALGKPPKPKPPKEPQRDDWFLAHPYPMPPNFTGREAERDMLNGWLDADAAHPLLSLRALGGFGKSALAWHWLTHDVKPVTWPRVVWWSFYESYASFDNFVERTVSYLKAVDPTKLGPRQRVDALLDALHKPGSLLILDGFERVLRAYGGLNAAYQGDDVSESEVNDCDCISPLAELFLRGVAALPAIRAKVLLTTRLRPAPAETRGGILLCGCREEELTQLQPADAVEFFRAQGIRGTHTEIEMACEPYGYHPLSLRLLAGLIVGDFQQPGDIAAARHLDVSGDLKARQHHVLEQAYNSLTPVRQKLLSRIACFRSPVKYEALKALAETAEKSAATLDDNLRDLISRGLLHHDTKEGRFDLHPIVRRYAYDRLAAPDRTAAHTRLRDYFAAVPQADKVTCLEDLAPVIELYHHTVCAGQFDEAFTLYRDRLKDTLYYQLGAYQLIIGLLRAFFPDGEDRPPRLKAESDQAGTLNDLALVYSLSGQPHRAVPLFEASNAIDEKRGDKRGVAIGLVNVADDQLKIGALRAAEANLRRSIALCREIKGEEFKGAIGYQELGLLLAYRGAYKESETELAASEIAFDKIGPERTNFVSVVRAYRAVRELHRLRSDFQSGNCNPQSAIGPARRALELADETARTEHPYEIDYIRAHWVLGAAHRVAGHTDDAERHLHEALARCRQINMVEFEADILIDLARLSAATGAPDEAQRLAEEALVITERSGYVLQGADVHLELAKLARARGDKATYDEAGALLAKLES